MSFFDDQLSDFPPFSGRNSPTDVPLVIVDFGGQIAYFILVHC